ncbi:hypothetical protein [Fibrella forsythiae]|uniref:Uncharacterized protein n=1 Tax=Fibrella forsythiae TaxID=2817061 RepID=A0ABS3JK39_9BACT|nr:hypothetical protein [Fibrella forsythiae]MBO0950360.1 hypothetical protein [Fibrella forsythiae]
MICLGKQPHVKTDKKKVEPTVAHLRAYELFKADFEKRHPGGLVFSELEYKGSTTYANPHRHSIRVGNQQHDRLLDALGDDFRRWLNPGDFRKPDGIGINAQGTVGELLEVTTRGNKEGAITQMRDKLSTLEGINRTHDLRVYWKPTSWRPANTERELYYPVKPWPDELIRYVCFNPTYRDTTQPGIVLYEMHAIPKSSLRSVPAAIPQPIREPLQTAYKRPEFKLVSAAIWAERFLTTYPTTKPILQGLAFMMGAGALVVAILLAFDPIPGDEVAAAYAAMALIRLARR